MSELLERKLAPFQSLMVGSVFGSSRRRWTSLQSRFHLTVFRCAFLIKRRKARPLEANAINIAKLLSRLGDQKMSNQTEVVISSLMQYLTEQTFSPNFTNLSRPVERICTWSPTFFEISFWNDLSSSAEIGPLVSHVTSALSERQSSSTNRKPLEREQAAEPVKPGVPGGEPITLDVARVKKIKIKYNKTKVIHLYLTPCARSVCYMCWEWCNKSAVKLDVWLHFD